MMKRYALPLVMALALLVLAAPPPLPLAAQDAPTTCPALVAEALEQAGEACTILGRNDACYGHNRVDTTFWQEQTELTFAAPADRVPLADLRTVATAPLDLDSGQWGVAALHVQADVPDTIPGQAVMFLLLGDAAVENAVSPEDAAPPVVTAPLVVLAGSNLRSAPDSASNVVGTVASGDVLDAVGVDSSGEWYLVPVEAGGYGWIWRELVTANASAIAALPLIEGDALPAAYGPMQAFYFSAGLSDPTCQQAPDALVIQGPIDYRVTFNINDLEVSLGSTVIFMLAGVNPATDPAPAGSALVAVLVEGELETAINGQPVLLNGPGQAFAVTLNDEGKVDEESQLVEPAAGPLQLVAQNACRDALGIGIFEVALFEQDCLAPLTYVSEVVTTPTPLPTRIPATLSPPQVTRQPSAPTSTATPGPTATPTATAAPRISFVADRTEIDLGDCVTLSWAVENTREVYYQGQPTVGTASQQECPEQTSTYTLRIIHRDGTTQDLPLTITVFEPEIAFTADRYQIAPGECVNITWVVRHTRAVYYQSEGVVGEGTRQECPRQTTTYTLRVITRQEQTIDTPLTITVGGVQATEEPLN